MAGVWALALVLVLGGSSPPLESSKKEYPERTIMILQADEETGSDDCNHQRDMLLTEITLSRPFPFSCGCHDNREEHTTCAGKDKDRGHVPSSMVVLIRGKRKKKRRKTHQYGPYPSTTDD